MFPHKHLEMHVASRIVKLNNMDDKFIKILEEIKKLLILDLITKGIQGKDIAQVLGVDKSTITRIVPSRKIKISKTNEEVRS